VFARRLLGISHGRLADGRPHQVEPHRGAGKPPRSAATATKARNNSKFSKQLILFFDQSYY
jgi:hypothetical protein